MLGIPLQQALALQATAYTLTDQLHQVLQLTFIRRPDALELRGPVVAIDICPIEKQDMKMYIEIKSRAEALYQPGRAGVTAPVARLGFTDHLIWHDNAQGGVSREEDSDTAQSSSDRH